MSMNVNNNLSALQYKQLQQNSNSHGIGIGKLSSGNNVNNNQIGLRNSSINSQTSFTIPVFKTVSQEANTNDSVENTSNGNTSFTIEATKLVGNNGQNITSASNISGINKGEISSGTSANNTQVRSNTISLSEVKKQNDIGVEQLNTADNGLKKISDYIERMQKIANSSASDTMTDKNRASLTSEFNDLKKEIDKIGKTFGAVDSENKNYVSFNLFNKGHQYGSVKLSFSGSTSELGLDSANISNKEDAKKAIENLNNAYKSISRDREDVGKVKNVMNQNIEDNKMLNQVGTTTLAQANQAPAEALKLLL